jgi:serine/threonine protein kinase
MMMLLWRTKGTSTITATTTGNNRINNNNNNNNNNNKDTEMMGGCYPSKIEIGNKNKKNNKTSLPNQTKNLSEHQQQQQQSVVASLPPNPSLPRKPRGCKCCRAPIEGRQRPPHYENCPLWESDGQPGLGWWSDWDHVIEVAVVQLEQQQQEQQQQHSTAEIANKNSHQKEKENNHHNNTPATTTTTKSTNHEKKTTLSSPYPNADELLGFGRRTIGNLISLPLPIPVTEIQDKSLAQHIACLAMARASEVAKRRSMEAVSLPNLYQPSSVNEPVVDVDPYCKMALFHFDELQLGDLLGVGGHSQVYEIQGFNLDRNNNSSNRIHTTASAATAKEKESNDHISRPNSVVSDSCGHGDTRFSMPSYPKYKAGVRSSSLSRRRSSNGMTTTVPHKKSKLYTTQQQLVREFLAQHALRPDQDCTEPTVDENDVDNTREQKSAYFGQTRESVSTQLLENSTSFFFSQDNQEELPTKVLGSGSAGKGTPRYAVKHLKPSLLQETPMPNRFAKAAMDLACEAEMMLGLDHPNIVKLRGFATGGPDQYKEGKHTSYFLILDRLTGTLHDRIVEWRQQYQEIHSWKRRWGYAWKRSKIVAGNCFQRLKKSKHQQKDKKKTHGYGTSSSSNPCVQRSESFSKSSRSVGWGQQSSSRNMSTDQLLLVERIKVAYDIACALEYLHEKGIIYRDVKSTNIGFNVRGDVQIFDFGLSRYLPKSTRNIVSNTSNNNNKNNMVTLAQEDEKESESKEIRRAEGLTQQERKPLITQPLSGDALSKLLLEQEESFLMSHVGTRRYTAPEIDMKLPYNLKADVYSFGVVLWEIMSMASAVSKGQNYITLAQDHASLRSVGRGGIKSLSQIIKEHNHRARIMVPCCCWPKPIQRLVSSMMVENPKNRPTMKNVRSVLEQVYISLSTDNPENTNYSQEMHILKRQRRRSTYCLETWALEASAMEAFLEEDHD